MIVACESCGTNFRLDPDKFKGDRIKVRCSRCGHVFTVEKPEKEELAPIGLPQEEAVEDDFEPQAPQTPPPAAPAPKKRPVMLRAAFWILGILVLASAIYWITDQKAPPLSGAARDKSARDAEQQATVTIADSLQAYFLENSHAGQVFVVEGEVLNESKKPVSFILVEGKLYTTGNQVAQKQRCYSGNVMTRDEVSRLSVTEIQNRMMNREGKNYKNVHIPASSRVPFMLIFHNLPELESLGDYSVEVVSSKLD